MRYQVYPRVCGGNNMIPEIWHARLGLSPRVRGKLNAARAGKRIEGSIPACAGETPIAANNVHSNAVYPRVCGGNTTEDIDTSDTEGLSPRVRGKPPPDAPILPMPRSIPACAGETLLGAGG